jgi:16S rRNA (adenine1518-N6/adenine1519-N6)-dimethyltransferase
MAEDRLPAGLLHQARKRFGQNFLHDQQVIQRIVKTIAPKPDDTLIEIGPGMGALTEHLIEACPRMKVIELDRDLVPGLRTRFFNYPDFEVIQSDALKVDFSVFGQQTRIVGNLPYNISTPLIFHLLGFRRHLRDMTFMLQKEVVERMSAPPGSGDYGRLSVMVQYCAKVESLFLVGPGAFHPAPKVWSAIVRLNPYASLPFPARNEAHFATLVRQAFSQRRKTLRNVLKSLLSEAQISKLQIDPGLRPERLGIEEFVRLSDAYTDSLAAG